MTASAVSAVSLEPPLLLVCVNLRDPLHEVLSEATSFAVNILASDQAWLSDQFAGKPDRRFENVDYTTAATGVPLLNGTVGSVVCTPWQSYPGGDHTIFVGTVIEGTAFDRRPLVHFHGGYATTEELR
jgi:flavin reductase (DIM6/NTAB) family NADH-FMN oxidoreductase RutF